MLLDLKEVQKLEKKYQNDRIALDALSTMVRIVSQQSAENLVGSIALTTLSDLGVIKAVNPDANPKPNKPQQLNS